MELIALATVVWATWQATRRRDRYDEVIRDLRDMDQELRYISARVAVLEHRLAVRIERRRAETVRQHAIDAAAALTPVAGHAAVRRDDGPER